MNRKRLSFISMGLAVVYCFGLILAACNQTTPASAVQETAAASASHVSAIPMEYQNRIFDNSRVLTIDIQINDSSWEALIDCEHFISPDSASVVELLIPVNKGLYLEDFINAIVPCLNAFALVSVLVNVNSMEEKADTIYIEAVHDLLRSDMRPQEMLGV